MAEKQTPCQLNPERPTGCRTFQLITRQLTQVKIKNIANTLLKNKATRRISHDRWRCAYRNKPSEEGVRLSHTSNLN